MSKLWRAIPISILTLAFAALIPLYGQGPIPKLTTHGKILSVDQQHKTFRLRENNGMVVSFHYNDHTKVEGVKNGVQGLSSEKGNEVTVTYEKQRGANIVTNIRASRSSSSSYMIAYRQPDMMTLRGKLTKVNPKDRTFELTEPDGRQLKFHYNDQTKVENIKNGIQGLSSEKGMVLAVRFERQDGKRVATRIEPWMGGTNAMRQPRHELAAKGALTHVDAQRGTFTIKMPSGELTWFRYMDNTKTAGIQNGLHGLDYEVNKDLYIRYRQEMGEKVATLIEPWSRNESQHRLAFRGRLINVDPQAKTFEARELSGPSMKFEYNNSTKVENIKNGIQGLSSQEGSSLYVEYKEENAKNIATMVEPWYAEPQPARKPEKGSSKQDPVDMAHKTMKAEGIVTNVDTKDQTFTIMEKKQHREMRFSYDKSTRVEGVKNGIQGLSSEKGNEVLVHYQKTKTIDKATLVKAVPNKK